MKKNSDKEWLSLTEAAAQLDLCNNTVYSLCRNGKLPSTKIGGQWRIKKSDLDALSSTYIQQRSTARPGAGEEPDARISESDQFGDNITYHLSRPAIKEHPLE